MNTMKILTFLMSFGLFLGLRAHDSIDKCVRHFTRSEYVQADPCFNNIFAQFGLSSSRMADWGETQLALGNYEGGWAKRDGRLGMEGVDFLKKTMGFARKWHRL